MNQTPEEKISNEIWALLNEIKAQILRLNNIENIRFDVGTYITCQRNNNHPFATSSEVEDVLRKFENYGVLVSLKKEQYNLNYTFTVNAPVFESVYKDYKFSFANTFFKEPLLVTQDISEPSGYLPEEAKLNNQLIEYISREIGNLTTGYYLLKFLRDMGVPEELIEYPQTKWRMVNQILTTLYFSVDPNKRNIAFSVIEGSCNPLMHNADLEKAKGFEAALNKYLMLGGYQLKYFKLGALKRYNAYENPQLRMYQNGPFVLNLSKGTMSYGNKSSSVSPKTKEIIFLSLLMETIGKIIEYRTIARGANLNVYNESSGNNDVELKKAVNYLRRDLSNYLSKQLKDTKIVSSIMDSIVNVTNLGYKMESIQQKLIKKSKS